MCFLQNPTGCKYLSSPLRIIAAIEVMLLKLSKILVLLFLVVATCCVSIKKGEELEGQILTERSRLDQIERTLKLQGELLQTNDRSTKAKVASSIVSLEKLIGDVRRLSGDIGRLEIGIVTGELPGHSPEKESVAKTLRDMGLRLDALETAQAQLLTQLQDEIVARKKQKPKKKARRVSKSLKDLNADFDRKRYLYVAKDGPSVSKKLQGRKRQEASYLVAESLFKLGRIQESMVAFDDLTKEDLSADLKELSQARLADCFRILGQHDVATLLYTQFLKSFPKSKLRERVEKHLDALSRKEGDQ